MQACFSLGASSRLICEEAKEKYPDYICIALDYDVCGKPVYVAYGGDAKMLVDLYDARLVGIVAPRRAEIDAESIQDRVEHLVGDGHRALVIWGYAFFGGQK